MIRQTCVALQIVLLLWMPFRMKAAPQSSASQMANKPEPTTCPVTLPGSAREFGRRFQGREAMSYFEPGTSRWKPSLSVGLWPGGTVAFKVGGAGIIEPDGSLAMKFGWVREGLYGKLKIHGRRLDAPAPPLRARIPDGYGDTGGQSTMLIFPTEGCWEVTGKVGRASLTFVTRVV